MTRDTRDAIRAAVSVVQNLADVNP